MEVTKSPRGFEFLNHPVYVESAGSDDRLASQSSAIGEYDDAFDRPGSSYLWIGRDHHLSREQVSVFVDHLKSWLETGKLSTQ